MAVKKSQPVEEVKPVEKPFEPIIVQDISSRIVRARRVHSQEELDACLARGWVIRG